MVKHPRWEMLYNIPIDNLGYIPSFLDEDDERSAVEQLDSNYRHGGGWNEFKGFTFNPETGGMKYPGDPEYLPLARCKFREETVYFYNHAWVTVVKADGSVSTARMD